MSPLPIFLQRAVSFPVLRHPCCAPLEVRPDFPWGTWEEEEEAVQSSAQFSVLGSAVQAASMVDGDMLLVSLAIQAQPSPACSPVLPIRPRPFSSQPLPCPEPPDLPEPHVAPRQQDSSASVGKQPAKPQPGGVVLAPALVTAHPGGLPPPPSLPPFSFPRPFLLPSLSSISSTTPSLVLSLSLFVYKKSCMQSMRKSDSTAGMQ